MFKEVRSKGFNGDLIVRRWPHGTSPTHETLFTAHDEEWDNKMPSTPFSSLPFEHEDDFVALYLILGRESIYGTTIQDLSNTSMVTKYDIFP